MVPRGQIWAGIGLLALVISAPIILSAQQSGGLTIRATESYGVVAESEPLATDDEVRLRAVLGATIESVTRTQELSLSFGTALDSDPGGSPLDYDNANLSGQYRISARDARLTFAVGYSDADIEDAARAGVTPERELSLGLGNRRDGSVRVALETGLGGPFETRSTLEFRTTDFRNTTNAGLIDSERVRAGLSATLRPSRNLAITTGLDFDLFTAYDNDDTERTTTTVHVGAQYLSPRGISYHTALYLSETRNETRTFEMIDSGPGFEFSVSAPQPSGTVSLAFASRFTTAGQQSDLRVGRTFATTDAEFRIAVGAIRAGDAEVHPALDLVYERPMPKGSFRVAFSQSPTITDSNDDAINSRLSARFSTDIDEISSWSASFGVSDTNTLDDNDDNRLVDFGVEYRRQVTRDWQVVVGVSHVRTESEQGRDRESNILSVALEREFVFRP